MVRLNVSAAQEQHQHQHPHPHALHTQPHHQHQHQQHQHHHSGNNNNNSNGGHNNNANSNINNNNSNLSNNVSSTSSSTSSLNSNASSFEQHPQLQQQQQQHRTAGGIVMVVPQQQQQPPQQQQQQQQQQQPQYAHVPHAHAHHAHHHPPPQSQPQPLPAVTMHQPPPPPQQHSPSDGSTSSLPASPPLLQQTATPPQGAQIVSPVCAVHHPQQHQQQQLALVAAMHQAHLAAALAPPHLHHAHHGPSPHGGPPTQHGIAAAAPQQQQQHSQQHSQENGHGGGGGGGGGGGPGVSPSGSSGSSAGSAGSAGSAVQVAAAPPPAPLYIQYPGDFYPAEYYIAPHPHDGMCPQHAHHHQPICAMPTDYGPTTVQMVSQNRPPPMPVPVQVPQGQVMQQYVNESGTLTHVVLSPQQYQQLHAGQGHIHAPFLTANGTSHFYPQLPTGFPPGPGGGPAHFHALSSGHLQPQPPQQQQQQSAAPPPPQPQQTPPQQPMSHSPHSPSPPGSYHKDERSQRQHTKLLRKLEKQREYNSALSTPAHSPSPRRSDLNGHHNHVSSSSGASGNGNSSQPTAAAITLTTTTATATLTSVNSSSSSNNNNANSHNHHHYNHTQYHQQQQLNNHNNHMRRMSQRNGTLPVNAQHLSSNNAVGSGVGGGASSVGTSEDGEDNTSSVAEDEEDYQASIIDQLSAIQKPEVVDITSRSAKIIWEAPAITDPLINTRDLRYNVLLSDRAKECKYKSLYKGESYDCIVQDLQPGQVYVVRLQVHYEKLEGSASEPTEFTTPPCEPDQPLPPKLVMSTKNSLHLRWTNPHANGAPIQHYLLEYDEGKTAKAVRLNAVATAATTTTAAVTELHFVEATKTKGKHYILNKLQPSTVYHFRLAAINEVGPSLYSPICTYSTTGNPPTAPKPPTLQALSSSSLHLVWERRQQDGDYVLQMLDRESGHGYLTMYNGPEIVYECCQLRRATSYQFRLRAENEAGASPWSNEVSYKTQPERPGRPGKPHVKGKIHGTHFRARWEPPIDTGGADIVRYFLEITSGQKFERIYSGAETETTCDRLQPGTTYQLRASCEGPAGVGPYSEVAHITSEAIVPAAPPPPYYDNPPGPYAAVLRLDKPDYNGGAPVLEFELQLRRPADVQFDTSDQTEAPAIVYRGKDAYCVVKDLQPGCPYEVQVRAINRIGAGAWSSWFRFSSAAAPPHSPEAPRVVIKSATHLLVSWQEPGCNGAPISEYRLESATIPNDHDSAAEAATNASAQPPASAYQMCYQGAQTNADLRSLLPFTVYYFRVNASNVAGVSKWSPPVNAKTPATVPAAPLMKDCVFTANEVTLNWTQPECNGSPITAYTIEYAERSITMTDVSTEYTVSGLAPETTYKFRVQALNAIGAGPYSAYAKLTTLPSPPAPPMLECTGVGHNFIKLKWGDGRNPDFTKYYVEMYVQRAKEFQIVYSGTNCMCKVNKLQERTAYTFRIYASTDRAGVGDYSEEYVFSTTATLPSSIKAPRVAFEGGICLLGPSGVGVSSTGFIPSGMLPETPTSFIAGLGNLSLGVPLTLEWQSSKNTFSDRVEYTLQYAIGKDGEFKKIYRGPETKFTIENLEPATVYQFRVCPIRVTSAGDDLPGQYTSAFRYQVPLTTLDAIDGSLLSSAGVFSSAATAVGNSASQTGSAACHGHSHHAHHSHHGGHHVHHAHNHSHHSHHNSRHNGATSGGLHHRSVSASAVSSNSSSGSTSNSGAGTLLIGTNAIGLIPLGTAMASELAANFAGCDDPHHHHHHHHHHQFHGAVGNDGDVSPGTTATLLAATANSLLANNALLAHTNAANHAQNGAIRRFVGKLTSVYTNRKRFTDQEKAVIFMVSFLFFTFLFATLVKMFMR